MAHGVLSHVLLHTWTYTVSEINIEWAKSPQKHGGDVGIDRQSLIVRTNWSYNKIVGEDKNGNRYAFYFAACELCVTALSRMNLLILTRVWTHECLHNRNCKWTRSLENTGSWVDCSTQISGMNFDYLFPMKNRKLTILWKDTTICTAITTSSSRSPNTWRTRARESDRWGDTISVVHAERGSRSLTRSEILLLSNKPQSRDVPQACPSRPRSRSATRTRPRPRRPRKLPLGEGTMNWLILSPKTIPHPPIDKHLWPGYLKGTHQNLAGSFDGRKTASSAKIQKILIWGSFESLSRHNFACFAIDTALAVLWQEDCF